MARTLKIEILPHHPGCVVIVEREGGMVLREIALQVSEAQQLFFDGCKMATEILKRERVQS